MSSPVPLSSAVGASRVVFTSGTAREMDHPNYYVAQTITRYRDEWVLGNGGGGTNTGLVVGVAVGALIVLVLGGVVLSKRRPRE